MSNHAPLIKVHVHEHTGTLTLNRPNKRNALTRAMLAELLQALDDLRCERRVRTIVISAQERASAPGWICTKCSKRHDIPMRTRNGMKMRMLIGNWSSR